jgi:hypothetical protein
VDIDLTFDAPSAEGNTCWLSFYDAEGVEIYESAQACNPGRQVRTFITSGFAPARIEVSERLTPTAHDYAIHIHVVIVTAS